MIKLIVTSNPLIEEWQSSLLNFWNFDHCGNKLLKILLHKLTRLHFVVRGQTVNTDGNIPWVGVLNKNELARNIHPTLLTVFGLPENSCFMLVFNIFLHGDGELCLLEHLELKWALLPLRFYSNDKKSKV